MDTFDATTPFRGSEAVATGRLTRGELRGPRFRKLGTDTYVSAAVPDEPRLAVRAASVAAGPGAVVTGWSAALWWRCDVLPWPPPPVELAVPDRRVRAAPGLVAHRSRIRAEDVTLEDDLLVTTTLRTAYDLVVRSDLDTGIVAADGLGHVGRFGRADLLAIAEELGPRRGCRRIAEVAQLMDPKAESPQETRVRLRLLRAGLPHPVTQFEVLDRRRFVARVDFAWPESKLALEYDGWDHTVDDRRGIDVDRIDDLRRLGWTVIVVTNRQYRRRGWIENRVREELGV
ncbi:endonuclease domain-containing protein [Actinomycetospora atypica]|uniref:Endonuclease domain-containing protein n=1 Tax=Actinomycetospora atypica TaxID=1290095 RepID=A0ABV9YR36_9PSEU